MPTAMDSTSTSSAPVPEAGSSASSSAAGNTNSDSAASSSFSLAGGPRAGPRQPQARPRRRRPPRRQAPHPGHAHLRRGRHDRGRAEAGQLAQPQTGDRLAPEPRTLRLPAHRQPARLRGQQRRRAGRPHADLAREAGHGQAPAPTHPRGARVEHRHGAPDRQSVRPRRAGPRPATRYRAAHAGAAPSRRGGGGWNGAGVAGDAGGQARVRVPGS